MPAERPVDSNGDLRLYSTARTATCLKGGADLYSPDVIEFRSDINLEERNPDHRPVSGEDRCDVVQLPRRCAAFRRGGEEGQTVLESIFGGYVPSTTAPVPEPSSWALMLAEVGLAVVAMRRRRSIS
ncbi:MAG: PEP-CTERM sorting domain-containing protein [Betaproteobacteria bacterium]